MSVRFVIVGGGPAGYSAASVAARLGAQVTLIERDVVGGAAHLYDCIPSKAMIATGGMFALTLRAAQMGLAAIDAKLDFQAISERIGTIEKKLEGSIHKSLESQGVNIVPGRGRLDGPHRVVAEAESGAVGFDADAILISTGAAPRIPSWINVDHERILTTRDAYPPKELPDHLIVVGSGVTGVEFVHMFSSFGCEVTLLASRQQVLPQKDPEVAAALEDSFIERGVHLVKGARAQSITRDRDIVTVEIDDGRVIKGSHVLLALGSAANSAGLGLEECGVEIGETGFIKINPFCQTTISHIYAAGDVSGKLPLSSVADMQGKRVAEQIMGQLNSEYNVIDYEKSASAIFTEPEIADVGLAEAEAFSIGRKVRVTKVPFAANARALMSGDSRGFVKLVSDPATGIILGGSIVGANAAELISIVSLAVTSRLRVVDLANSLFPHPTLAESLIEAAE